MNYEAILSEIQELYLADFSNLQFPYRSERRLDGGFRLIGVANRKAIFQRKPLMAVCFEALK
ncbi:hypothetical protein FJZ31_24955, partial [Candidatus Poribacteria bacterium]|nr:hypothetical protein [Candidatus Poribacteria bacterium]